MVSNGGIVAGGNTKFLRERRALISYGFSQDIEWDPEVHSEEMVSEDEEVEDNCLGAVYSPYIKNMIMLKNRIKWAVRRDQVLEQVYRHTLEGKRYLPKGRNAVHMKEDLYMSRVVNKDDLSIYGTESMEISSAKYGGCSTNHG